MDVKGHIADLIIRHLQPFLLQEEPADQGGRLELLVEEHLDVLGQQIGNDLAPPHPAHRKGNVVRHGKQHAAVHVGEILCRLIEDGVRHLQISGIDLLEKVLCLSSLRHRLQRIDHTVRRRLDPLADLFAKADPFPHDQIFLAGAVQHQYCVVI